MPGNFVCKMISSTNISAPRIAIRVYFSDGSTLLSYAEAQQEHAYCSNDCGLPWP